MKTRPITIKDIAKYLSVSTSTVSRALMGDKNIRTETKEKVLQAAQLLGYVPNPVATNLRYGRTNTIGIVVPEMITPFASSVIGGIQSVLYPLGYKVMIAESNEDYHHEKQNLEMMKKFRVDGVIICLCNYKENKNVYLDLQHSVIPIVFYDRIPFDMDVSQVIVDDYKKSFFLVEHLIRTGCRKIIHIMGPDYIYNSTERFRGYKDALIKHHIPFEKENIIKTGLSFQDGAEVADLLVDNDYSFDSIFAFTDTLAIGAMNRLRELSKKIPEDVAIASFSGTVLSTIVYPQLTTVEAPLHLMGEKAAQLILKKIKDENAPNRKIVLDADIKYRASSDK